MFILVALVNNNNTYYFWALTIYQAMFNSFTT